MSDKKNNSQCDTKGDSTVKPKQVPEADKHLGATADEDIPQDDAKSGHKQTTSNQKQTK